MGVCGWTFHCTEEDDAGTAGVLSGGDYISGVFWARALDLGA